MGKIFLQIPINAEHDNPPKSSQNILILGRDLGKKLAKEIIKNLKETSKKCLPRREVTDIPTVKYQKTLGKKNVNRMQMRYMLDVKT